MQLGNQPQRLEVDSRYNRDEKEDLKKGLDHLWEFRQKLAELHPNVVGTIEALLQRQRY
jgi:hypothetical protein